MARMSLLVLQGAPATVRILSTKAVPARLEHAALLHLYFGHLQTEQDAISCWITPISTTSGTPDSVGTAHDTDSLTRRPFPIPMLLQPYGTCDLKASLHTVSHLATFLHRDLINLDVACGFRGTRWRCCAANRKAAGSIPDGVIGIFHWHIPSGRTMALGLTQPQTEISMRNISWGVKTAGV